MVSGEPRSMPMDQGPRLVAGRTCGTCMMCCKVPAIEEFAKPPGVWCRHAVSGKGCGIYADRPGSALQAQLFYLLNRHRQQTTLRQTDLFSQVTIADYFAVALTTAGELIDCDFKAYPNIARWLANMKKRPGYPKTYEVFTGFAGSLKGQQFQRI